MDAYLPLAVVGLRFGRHVVRDDLSRPSARAHVRTIRLCDMDYDVLREATEEFALPGTPDYDEILADPNVRAVALYTPPRHRASLIRKAIRAGKHVMTTKPFERDADAAEDVLAEAREAGVVVHANSPSRRLAGATRRILAWQDEYDLGRPVQAHWSTWASYHETADGGWLDSPVDCPVAPIFRLGIYGINELARVFGTVEDARVLSSRLRTGRPTPDNGLLTLKFESGLLATISANFCMDVKPYYRNTMTVAFERGRVVRDLVPFDGEERVRTRLRLESETRGELVEYLPARDNGGEYQWDLFAQAVRGLRDEADEAAYHRSIVNGLRIIEAMEHAAR